MGSDSGPRFERDVLPWLQVLFPNARRSGKGFPGADYINTPGFSIEAKNRKRLLLGEWMKQVMLYREQAGTKYPVVVHKRRNFGAHQAFVTMPLEDWVAMVAELKGLTLPEDLYPVSDDVGPADPLVDEEWDEDWEEN